MNNRVLLAIIAIVVVIIIALFAFNRSGNNELADQTNSAANVNAENTSNSNAGAVNANANVNTPAATTNSPTAEDVPDGNDVAVFEINYDGKAYTPSQLTIKTGDVVVFKNNSDGSFWPASAPHPAHTNYPEFDPKKGIAAGQSWQFKFTKAGAWGFHDHLNPSAFGRITVQ